MEKDTQKTENLLASEYTSLTRAKKDLLWNAIETDIKKMPVPSPFLFSFIHTKHMAPIALALVLLLGAGTTVAASGTARPGDLLFPVDQALEEVRLALATNDESRAHLHLRFAEERIEELRSLLAEDDSSSSTSTDDTSSATTTIIQLEAEADVFTDTTIVKVEINDRKTTFETTADTRDEVIDAIVSRFSIDRARVEAVLDFEIEDRSSRMNERISVTSDTRVETSLSLLDALLSEISESDRDRIISEAIDSFSARHNSRIEIRNDNDDNRIEMRDDDSRVRIREKDGEIRIDVKDDRNDDSDDSDDSDNSSSSGNSFEAEADVFTDTTIVKVEINDRKTTFETTADTRTEVIDAIVARFNIDRARVEAVLDFEIEDRSSRTDDTDTSDDDSSSDDSSSDDSDDASDDSDGQVKIEVRVEDGMAEVRLEYGDKRDEFETIYTTKTALIATIATRSGLSATTVSGALDLEIKD